MTVLYLHGRVVIDVGFYSQKTNSNTLVTKNLALQMCTCRKQKFPY
jgi:hypothetical protein